MRGERGGGGGGRGGSESTDRAIVSASCCVASRSTFKAEDDELASFLPSATHHTVFTAVGSEFDTKHLFEMLGGSGLTCVSYS